MDSSLRVARAIQKRQRKSAWVVYGVYLGAEDVDADLSRVTVAGAALDGTDTTLRFVPRGDHVTGLTAGDTVLIVGSPLCIIARVVGDISLADLTEE